MRRLHEAIGAVETYSPAEERFNRRRRTAGLFLAPAVLLLLLVVPLPGLAETGHRLAAVMAAVVVLWVSEALPMAATAPYATSIRTALEPTRRDDSVVNAIRRSRPCTNIASASTKLPMNRKLSLIHI